MSPDDIRKQLAQAAAAPPFWVALHSGDRLCCQGVLGFHGGAITVVTGTVPRMVFAHQIKQISNNPLIESL